MDRLFAILLLISFGACTWNTDKEVPEVYVAQPANNATLMAGDTVMFEISAVDDQLLSRIDYSLSPNFDSLWIESLMLPAWRVEGDTSVNGNTFFWKGYWHIPDSISVGNYLLTCNVSDANGQTQSREVALKLSTPMDSLNPSIDSLGVPDSVAAGQDWSVYLGARDDVSLRYFTLQLLQDNDEIWREVVTLTDTVSQWDSTFTNPGTSGFYNVRIVLRDWVNKTSTRTVGVLFE